MYTSTSTISAHPTTMKEKVDFLFVKMLSHRQAMKSYYNDFSESEHEEIIGSSEHSNMNDALNNFYLRHAL